MSLSPSRKPAGSEVGSVWLSSTRSVPPSSPTGHRGVEPAGRDAQVVEHPQRRAGEVAQLGVVPLGLQLGDHHDGQDDLVLLEPGDGPWVREQDGGVEHVGATRLLPGTCGRCRSRARGHGRSWGEDCGGLDATTRPGARPGGGTRRVGPGADGVWGWCDGCGDEVRLGRRCRARLRRRSGAAARRRRAAPAGSRPCGSPASRPRRSRTRCARSARAGSPPSRCSPEVRMTRSGSGWPLV